MKKKTKKLIAWGAFALAIIACGVVLALSPGFNFNGVGSFHTYKNASSYAVGNGEVDALSHIEIHWLSGEVSVERYAGDAVAFSETADREIEADLQLRYLKQGETLVLQFAKSGFYGKNVPHKKLTVKIPQTLSLSSLLIDVVSADVSVTDIASADFSVETVSGAVTLTNCGGSDFEFEGTSGDLTALEMAFSDYDIEGASSKIALSVKAGSNPQKADIETVSGNIKLTLPAAQGFSLEMDSLSGDLSVNRQVTSVTKKSAYFGDGAFEIEIDTTSGDVTVN